eukprot:TRINITY_DN6140_c0_g1_i2.p1 TRINITY_DN6140_c0_g1~~TRINITY_DN6140_c0_g1_i2.p1  ORF type:complete len:337 (+),score=51.72 TRINITY_DN6140_c0_g1_i2:44-1012(+)
MTEFLQVLKSLDPSVTGMMGPYGKAQVITYDGEWKETNVVGLCVVGLRTGAPPKITLLKGKSIVSEREVRAGMDSVQADDTDLVILRRENDRSELNGYRFDSAKESLAVRKALAQPDPVKPTNGAQAPPPPVPVPVPIPVPIQQHDSAGSGMSTPGRDLPPPVPTPGSSVGKVPTLPAAPTPGVKPAPPPPVPTPGSTVGKQGPKSQVPPPIPVSRAPSLAKSGVPPPVPTPTGQGVFPAAPLSPTIFNTSPATTHHAPPQNVFSSPPAAGSRVSQIGHPRQRSEQPSELAASLCISPPTKGPNGWQAGPDINQLRLAVIKV